MTHPQPLSYGDVVYLLPNKVKNRAFAGCLAFVSEARPFGALLSVQLVGHERGEVGAQTFFRAGWDEFVHTGGSVALRYIAEGLP